MKKSSVVNIIIRIIFSLFLIFNISLIFTYEVLKCELPNFFNISVFIEKTNIMNPTIEPDAIVISKKVDSNDLKVNDIIIYYDETNDIYSAKRYIEKDSQNNLVIKGDSEISKTIIKNENVKGKYLTSFKTLGKFLKFMSVPVHFILVNMFIILLFIFIKLIIK